jgi:predicted transcriptional regulator
MNLRGHRNTLGISQSRLARLSRVSRFKICLYELGDGPLAPDEQDRIREALRAEADRLRSIPAQIDVGELFFANRKPGGLGEQS